MSIYQYDMKVRWSETDNAYIATHPEAPGCFIFGKTEEEARRQLEDAMRVIYEAGVEENQPTPRSVRIIK